MRPQGVTTERPIPLFEDYNDWLTTLGFRYDPFYHLNSASDPHLAEYLIGHEAFANAWEARASLIFAPAGGGKTAMRLYTTRSCWVGVGRSHPFPVPYLPTNWISASQLSDVTAHWLGLARSIAATLLIAIAHLPDLFLGLSATRQQLVGRFFNTLLPRPLDYYAAVLREGGPTLGPTDLAQLLDRSYNIPHQPRAHEFQKLVGALVSLKPTQSRLEAQRYFFELVQVILQMGFSSVLLLVDGVDGVYETASNPTHAAESVAWLFAQHADLAAQRIFVKGFLPLEVETPLRKQLKQLGSTAAALTKSSVRLVWPPNLLAEVIRRRVYVASDGAFDSLNALSSSGLREWDVDMHLVQGVEPLPREVILASARTLQALWHRANQDNLARLDSIDVEVALSRTRREYPVLRPTTA